MSVHDGRPYPYETNPRGHVWKRDEDGAVDIFAFSIGTHNGPACAKCGYRFCHHCDDGPTDDCTAVPQDDSHD